MNAPDRLAEHLSEHLLDWSSENQQLLVAEFTRLRALLGDVDADANSAATLVAAQRADLPAPAAIDTLADLFKLSAFERDLLLLVAGVEMDARIAALCAAGSGQPQRPWATFGLALAALPQPHWSAIAPLEPLRRWRLLEVNEEGGTSGARLKLDERVLHFIAGLNYLDHRLQPLLQPMPEAGAMGQAQHAVCTRVLAQLRATEGRLPTIVLEGDDTAGQQDVAAAVAAGLGAGLFRLRGAEVPAAPAEQAAFAALWSREAALLGCGLAVVCEPGDSHDHQNASTRLLERLDGLVFVIGEGLSAGEGLADVPQLRQTLTRPEAPERRQLWQRALAGKAEALAPALDTLASQYRLGARRIQQVAALARGDDAAEDSAALHRASRGGGARMPGLAQRIETRVGWANLVLPDGQQAVLRQIAAHARHRLKVFHTWGFASQGARGLGLSTLFWGDSGTGKTLGAEVLANELGLSLYRIDLSAVVSKYIGETEKNLKKLFDAAEETGAILLFDEADALFGKRSEVKDSHDRYANIEVSYLLQRMEAYSGVAILTSNHKAALDNAFQRRLRFVVQFPFPDQAQREGIWRAVFPAGAPLAGNIDYPRLARLSVPGGTIRNIALAAAFLAAEDGGAICMAHLLQAARMEATKRDKPYSDAETRGWT